VSNGKSELEEVGEAVFATARVFFLSIIMLGERNERQPLLFWRARIPFFYYTHTWARAATQNARLSNENVTEMQRRQKVEMNGERERATAS
jgi:hypothetical protein